MDFLSVCSTPPCRILWLHHAVRILVVRWSSELCATFPMNLIFRVAICFLVLGISKQFTYCLICDALIFHLIHDDA